MINILTLRLTNEKVGATTFVLEPYGDVWPMPAGATYEIRFEIVGDSPHHLPEIVTSDNAITVYSGGQGHVAVFQDGREINSSVLHSETLQRAA